MVFEGSSEDNIWREYSDCWRQCTDIWSWRFESTGKKITTWNLTSKSQKCFLETHQPKKMFLGLSFWVKLTKSQGQKCKICMKFLILNGYWYSLLYWIIEYITWIHRLQIVVWPKMKLGTVFLQAKVWLIFSQERG